MGGVHRADRRRARPTAAPAGTAGAPDAAVPGIPDVPVTPVEETLVAQGYVPKEYTDVTAICEICGTPHPSGR